MTAWETIGQPIIAYTVACILMVAILPKLYEIRMAWIMLYWFTVPLSGAVITYLLLRWYT